MILDFLYNIIIFPLVQIMEISFVIIQRISQNYGIAIIGVSAVFTFCTMPLYFMAEKFQHTERDIQKKMKPDVDNIKAVFSGDEQFMRLSTYYRQNHYHPFYSFRNSLSVLIQVPFFIAAYSYLSHLAAIKEVSFLFIQNLGTPDRFMSIGGFSLNILPIIMTLINCASGTVYTRGFPAKDKIQVYGIALVFLVLLYNSPAGLVLYWTMNNIFSLAKNILAKIKSWKKIVYCFFCLCALFIIIRHLFIGFNKSFSANRILLMVGVSLIFFTPLFIKFFKLLKNKVFKLFVLNRSIVSVNSTYILSALILFVLCGLVIPGSLIASSVPEFSFLDSFTTPLPFLGTVVIQAAGIFLFWPLCIYFLFSKKVKYGLSFIFSLVCISALVNTFLFPLNYGDITTLFIFSNPDNITSGIIVITTLITIVILIGFAFLLLSKRKLIFHSFQLIILIALISFGIMNIYKINKDFTLHEQLLAKLSTSISDEQENVYCFSRTGKNVIVFMLDASISGYVPYIFEEKPELLNDFSGFTYYPNCVSHGHFTKFGAPLVFGGYEYKPENIHKNYSFAREKHNESLLLLPRLFLKEDYRITVTDPTYVNYNKTPELSIFEPYPEIAASYIIGNYTTNWLHSHQELKLISIPDLLKELLIRFSFFKISPPIVGKIIIYDKANWLRPNAKHLNDNLTMTTVDNYTTLDYLPLITKITDDNINTYTAIINELTHEFAIFQFPDYIPTTNVTNIGNGPFAENSKYHMSTASFLMVGKWLKFLQEEGVYDNTRIIFVSDHGANVSSNYKGNMLLPNNDWLSYYHALLLVKDFNSRGDIVTDTTFMTNGDVPLIAMEGLIDNPKNPFSGNTIENDKKNGVFITLADYNQYTINNDQWLYVHDNIFDLDNWKKVTK